MFSYCHNNAVNCIDPHGHAPSMTGSSNVSDGGSGYIYGQKNEPYGSFKYGLGSIGKQGCGAVATYNALLLLGEANVSLTDVISQFVYRGRVFLFGLLGTSATGVRDYFIERGYNVTVSRDPSEYGDMARNADACILWYGKGFMCLGGAHFVAFTQSGNTGMYYNSWNYQTGQPDNQNEEPEQYLSRYGAQYSYCIAISNP